MTARGCASEGPEAGEGVRRVVLVEANDGRRRSGLEALGGQLERAIVGPTGGDRPLDPLQEGAQDEPVGGPTTLGSPPESRLLRGRTEPLQMDAGGCAAVMKKGRPGAMFGWRSDSDSSAAGLSGSRASASRHSRSAPAPVAGCVEREAEVEPCHPASGMRLDERPQALEASFRPGSEGRSDCRLDRTPGPRGARLGTPVGRSHASPRS